MCGKLVKSMDGTRDAFQNGQSECAERVSELGFTARKVSHATSTARSGTCAGCSTETTLSLQDPTNTLRVLRRTWAGGPTVQNVRNEIRGLNIHPAITEGSLAYELWAKGCFERFAQTIQGPITTARGELEHTNGERMPDDPPPLHNRYHVGVGGRTPRERVAGRRSDRSEAEFAGFTMFMTKGPTKLRVGLLARSNEVYVCWDA